MIADHIEDEVKVLLLVVKGAIGYNLEHLKPQVSLGQGPELLQKLQT